VDEICHVFFFDEEKGGIFCRICIGASKSGGFCTKPAQEQARRCLTKHLNREKHKSALQQLRKDGKMSGMSAMIASGMGTNTEEFDDRSDSNDDPQESMHAGVHNNDSHINQDMSQVKNEIYSANTLSSQKSGKKFKKKKKKK